MRSLPSGLVWSLCSLAATSFHSWIDSLTPTQTVDVLLFLPLVRFLPESGSLVSDTARVLDSTTDDQHEPVHMNSINNRCSPVGTTTKRNETVRKGPEQKDGNGEREINQSIHRAFPQPRGSPGIYSTKSSRMSAAVPEPPSPLPCQRWR